MNKFHIAYIVVLVLFVVTCITVGGTALMVGPLAAVAIFWLPLLINGFLLYALRDWKQCGN